MLPSGFTCLVRCGLKASLLISLMFLSGCSWLHGHWFHGKAAPPPDPTELIVTGTPAASFLFVDGVQMGQAVEAGNKPQILDVQPGSHTLEVKTDDKVVYREDLDVAAGEKRVVKVLSGKSRF